MIGEIRKTLLPFYNATVRRMSIKSRPGLIIAKADSDDYVVLPISTITRQENRNSIYDIEVDPEKYPLLGLHKVSYIRTHKQTIVHSSNIADAMGNLKQSYEELYVEVLEKREQFSRETTDQAIE